MVAKKELKDYFKSVKKAIYCSFNRKYAFMSDFKDKVSDYLENNQNSSMDNIIKNFGTPEHISNSFKDISIETYKKKLRKYLIIEFISLLVIAFLIFMVVFLIKHLGVDSTITTQ